MDELASRGRVGALRAPHHNPRSVRRGARFVFTLDASGIAVWMLVVETLTKYVRTELSHKSSCTVFASEIERVWPQFIDMVAERNCAIHEFAKKNGWEATIIDTGVIVKFTRIPETDGDPQ